MTEVDAVVIGAGTNGLVAGCLLARAGLSVSVIEAADEVGGVFRPVEFAPGFEVSLALEQAVLLRPEILWEAGLSGQAIRYRPAHARVSLNEDGRVLARHSDDELDRRALAAFSVSDAEAVPVFEAMLAREAARAKAYLLTRPPSESELYRAVRSTRRVERLYSDMKAPELGEAVRFWTAPMADILADFFRSEMVMAQLAGTALRGMPLSPATPGSAMHLVWPFFNAAGPPPRAGASIRGGGRALAEALAAALKRAGGVLRTGTAVERIDVRDGKARSVILSGDEEILARHVLSSLDARHTIRSLFDWADLPDGLAEAAGEIVDTPSLGCAVFALDRAPRLEALDESLQPLEGGLVLPGSLQSLEQAYDAARAGRVPDLPWVELTLASARDPSLAPGGRHVLCATLHPLPAALSAEMDSSNEAPGDRLLARTRERIEQVAPGFSQSILHERLFAPADYAALTGREGGSVFQGDLVPHQLFFNRPAAALSRFRLPIRNVYLCGGAAHPGGPVIGASGANAARQLLGDFAGGHG